MLKVVIADDHPVVLQDILPALATEVGLSVAGHAVDSGELVARPDSTNCDVAAAKSKGLIATPSPPPTAMRRLAA